MGKRWKYTIIGVAITMLILFLALGWWIWSLQPARHFQHEKPIIATPRLSIRDTEGRGIRHLDNSADQGNEAMMAEKDENEESSSAFNVLLVGIDVWEGEQKLSRADTIMVAHVDPEERKVGIVSVPRDTRVEVAGVGLTKINHAHIVGEQENGNSGGTLLLAQTVSDFLGVPIHYYLKTNFSGVEHLIDTIGGIDLVIENDIHIGENNVIYAGKQHFSGERALSLARERYAVPGGDFDRQREQFRIVRAVAQEMLQAKRIMELPGLLRDVKKDILDTNFTDSDLISLAWLFADLNGDDLDYSQIAGESGYYPDPLVGSELYYWLADETALDRLRDEFE